MMDVIKNDCVEKINCTSLMFLSVYNTYKPYVADIIVRRAIEEIGAKIIPYDPDASLISSYIFCKTIDILEEGEWHIYSSKRGYEYKIRKDNGIYFRGDTMTSWVTSLNQCFESFKITELPEKEEERIKFLCNFENYGSKAVRDKVKGFLEAVYTIGNFCPVPERFNTARSGGGDYDYWDLTLMKIHDWYMDNDDNDKHLNDLLHIKEECTRNRQCIKNCKKWLEWFKTDAERKKIKYPENYSEDYDGWHNFVDTLYMQDYVYNEDNWDDKRYKDNKVNREYYDVIPFWKGHEWSKEGIKFPTDDENKKINKIEEAFETMTAMINARTNRIAQALVK